jgi:hypothetical protein
MSTLAKVNPKALAAAYICQGQDDVRYYLNGILIEPVDTGGVRCVATDGHRMIIVTDPAGHCEDPIIVAFESTTITKMRQKKASTVTVSSVDDDTDIAKISGLEHVSSVEIIDGTFPDYERVIKDKLPARSCQFTPFNGTYMKGFCDCAKVLGIRNNCIAFVFGETQKDSIHVLFGKAEDNLHARGVVMPVHYDAESMPWLAAVPE